MWLIESIVLESSTSSFISRSFVNAGSFVRESSVQLWGVNQRIMETEEVTDL
jgi:hypothetical protein